MLATMLRREKPAQTSKSGQGPRLGRTNSDVWPVLAEVQERFARPTPDLLKTAEKVNQELSQCRGAVNRIKCECDADSLLLTGVTSQYYYVQIALETALRHAGPMRVVLAVHVAVGPAA